MFEAGWVTLAAVREDPRWSLVGARGVVDVAPGDGTHATLTGWATLALDGGGWLALEVPETQVHALDGGCGGFVPRWTVHEVRVDGRAVPFQVEPLDRRTRVPWRIGRRLVLADVGAPGRHEVRVHWSQRVPWQRFEQLATTSTGLGQSTPLLPVFPTVAGARDEAPWELVARSPARVALVASGADEAEVTDGLRTVRARGSRLAEAGVVGGVFAKPVGDRVRGWSTPAGADGWLASIDGPLQRWSGVGLAPALDLVEVAATWLPTRSLWAEGVVLLRPQAALCDGGANQDVDTARRMSRAEVFALVEGAAAASWVGRVRTPGDGSAWLEGLARAFALDLVAGDAPAEARDWREALLACATAAGSSVRLAPAVSASSGFRQPGALCAAPIVLGPMLDDRLGREGADRVRRAVFASGVVDSAALVAAVLAEAPDAGPWVARWLLDGRVVELATAWGALGPDGTTVRGTLGPDLGGAPVEAEFRGRMGVARRVLLVPDADGAFEVTLPFAPTAASFDPDHRLLEHRVLSPMPWVPGSFPE